MDILVVGTVALDTVKTPFGKVKEALGGSAAYFALSASFFTKLKLVSVVGKDFPLRFIKLLKSRHIDMQGLQIKKGKTFRWVGRYTYDLNNPQTVSTQLNLLAEFKPDIPLNYRNEKFIFLANIAPEVQLKVLQQMRSCRLVALDTMNYWIEHEKKALKSVIKRSHLLMLNDSEARQFSQQANLMEAARSLLALGPRLVIIKRGEYGCLLFSRNSLFCLPAYLLENVIDPTGAGDTFAGGFLGYLASCKRINESAFKKAIAYGTIMASYAVEDFSLRRLTEISKKDIERRLNKFKRMTRF